MPGRAKGERFVIRGKERLDVGLHEDEFLLQAVFDCMGAGPNPAQQPESCPPAKPYPTAGPRQQAGPNPVCRAPMLAPRRRQSLIPPPGHANRPAQIPLAGRPCWRPSAVKTLCHRRATPTGRPKSRLPAVHVGASTPSKPYATAGPRQQAAPNPACRPSMLPLPLAGGRRL